jgi:hypothetical protein
MHIRIWSPRLGIGDRLPQCCGAGAEIFGPAPDMQVHIKCHKNNLFIQQN